MMRSMRDCNIWLLISAALFMMLLFSHSSKVLPEGTMPSLKTKAGPLNVRQRMERSEEIWQESVRRRQAALHEFPNPDNVSLFPVTGPESYKANPMSVWDFVPATYNCPWDMQRVGRIGDGGKWVCGMSKYVESKRPCVVYSMGVRDESTFEEEMIERTNCMIYAYDPAVTEMGPQMTKEALQSVVFTQAYVAGTTNTNKTPPMYTLKDMMAMNGHDYIDILKMDIEYFEFEVMSAFLAGFAAGNVPVGQFLVEIHLFKKRKHTIKTFLRWWEVFEKAGFRAAWTEPNLLWVTMKLDDALPRLAEYTLVNARDPRSILLEE